YLERRTGTFASMVAQRQPDEDAGDRLQVVHLPKYPMHDHGSKVGAVGAGDAGQPKRVGKISQEHAIPQIEQAGPLARPVRRNVGLTLLARIPHCRRVGRDRTRRLPFPALVLFELLVDLEKAVEVRRLVLRLERKKALSLLAQRL